jgi:hypothetical protein
MQVTSTIRFHDGHTEPGPSTEIASEANTQDAANSAIALINETIDDFHRTRFGAYFRRGFFESFKPINPNEKWNIKLDITYHVRTELRDRNGTLLQHRVGDITRPF